MTGLIPAYLKLFTKGTVLHIAKLFSPLETTFKKSWVKALFQSLLSTHPLKKRPLGFKEGTNVALMREGRLWDAITFGAAHIDKKLAAEFAKVRGKKTLQFKEDSDLTEYLQLYHDLAE